MRPVKQVRPQQIRGVEAREPGEIRPRRPSSTDDCHALSVSRIARDRPLDREPLLREVSPATEPAYRRVIVRACSAAPSARWARSVFATSSRPDVSLSSRWTIPSRPSSAPSDSGAAAPLERVYEGSRPISWRRVDHHPRRLVDDQTSSSSKTTASGMSSPSTARPAGSGISTVICSPARAR